VNSYKGKFVPKNKEKYVGNWRNIIYRSNLEFQYMKLFDLNPDIVMWSSETLVIPYKKPTDGKIHRYFVDFITKNSKGEINVIEIKPDYQTREPKITKGKSKRTILHETLTWEVNKSKWHACKTFCDSKGWRFIILTEKQIKNV